MRRALVAGALALAATACNTRDAPPPPATARPAAATAPAPAATGVGSMTRPTLVSAAGQARQIFETRCATCHGLGGRGDGEAAMSMQPPPRDYADPAWQASVADADLAAIIVAGGGAVGKSTMMPAASDLAGKPEVVAELVTLIRGFAAR